MKTETNMLKNSVITLLFLSFSIYQCYSHLDHGHSHDESPSFKYSRSANEEHQEKHHHHHHHDEHEEHTNTKQTKSRLSTQELWLHAMGSTILISAAPFFLLFVIPLENTDKEQPLLKILLAFASGGLLGDAFLHLIPHANAGLEEHGSHSHTHSHGGHSHDNPHNMSVGLWVLAGIVAFLVVEKSVRIIKGSKGHGHSHAKSKDTGSKKKDDGEKKNKKEPVKDIKVAGYLNLAADFSHNFTDGLAIGSSYLAGNTVGMNYKQFFKFNLNSTPTVVYIICNSSSPHFSVGKYTLIFLKIFYNIIKMRVY